MADLPPQQPAQQVGPLFGQLPDDLLPTVLTKWTSCFCLQTLSATCRRFNKVASSPEHLAARASEGIVDRALVVVSKRGDDRFLSHALVNGRWKQIWWNAEEGDVAVSPGGLARCGSSASGEHVFFTAQSRFGNNRLVNVMTGQREDLPGCVFGNIEPAICHFGNRAILAGGIDPVSCLFDSHAVEMFDPSTNTWSPLQEMPCAVQHLVSGVIDQKMYVLGHSETEHKMILQICDIITQTWEIGPEVPACLKFADSAAVVNGKLYVVGKSKGTNETITTVCVYFIPELMEWRRIAPIGPITIEYDPEYSSKFAFIGPTKIEYDNNNWNSSKCYAVNHNGHLWVVHPNSNNSREWKQLEYNGEFTNVSVAIAPKVPDHLVGVDAEDCILIKTVLSAVIKP